MIQGNQDIRSCHTLNNRDSTKIEFEIGHVLNNRSSAKNILVRIKNTFINRCIFGHLGC